MRPSWDPHHKKLVVSQVLLILIGSGMTYCQGEGDCHGPTGMGAGGVQGEMKGRQSIIFISYYLMQIR
ncbi:hypothetical protein INR49_019576 [Caranx melampygus]|nr:hypothetical protein INR49_019576 [Caranx melampygus]